MSTQPRDQRLLSRALSGLKGVKPPVEFGKRIRDSSPGHAGKEGVLCPKVGLLQAGFYGLLFFTQSVTLCLLIGAFSSLAFEVATQPSILACRIQWTEEPGGLYSPLCHKSWTRLRN